MSGPWEKFQPTQESADGPWKKFGGQLAEAEEAQSRNQMTHPAKTAKPKDMYSRQAQSDSFLENIGAGAGGALYGLGYLGPKSLLGLDSPGEVKDWKASMSGLGDTVGGTIGQVLGYGAPAAVAAPFVGASVPVATAVGASEGLLMPAESLSERGLNTVASAGGAMLGQAGGNSLANRATQRAANKAKKQSTRKAQNAVKDATLAMGKAEGYVVPPSYAGTGMWPRFFEGISGKYKTNQLAGIKNQEVTNALARKSLGLPENAPLTDEALDAYRAVVSQPYRDVANLPQRPTIAPKSNVVDWSAPVQAQSGFDPAAALESLKSARYNAKLYWRGANMGNPEALTLARQADEMADILETQIENYAALHGSPELVDNLRHARAQIAKSYTVEKALNEGTGNVDATKLGRMIEKGDPLSGDLEKAGKFGMAFGDVARPPKSGDANPITALDFLSTVPAAGMGGMAFGGPGAMAMTLLPSALRIGSRYSLLSGPVQRSLVNPKYSVGLLNKTIPPLLNNPLSRSLYPGAGIYGYGVQPGLE